MNQPRMLFLNKEQIQMLRRAYNMNTREFGTLLGVSARTVEGWEQGRKPIRLASLILRTFMVKLLEKTNQS